jgi:two-component system, cell cycle sensor histidine kinase and response regulator CckA
MASDEYHEFQDTAPFRSLRPDRQTAEQPTLPRDRGQLVVLIGDSPGRVYPIDEVEIVVGRSSEATIQLQGSDISRRHAVVRHTGPGVFSVVDLGSRNGTQVNGQPIKEHVLAFGDKVRFGGKTVLMFTQYDRVEDMLLQAQKLESIGHLAGGVAHDFNNLLTVILANLSYLRSLPPEVPVGEAELGEAMDDMDRAARRAADLTRQLLGITRPGTSDPKVLDVTELLEEVARLARRTFGPDVEVKPSLEPNLHVRGDAAQLNQVLMNLCLNARDAMPEGGQLTLTSSRFVVRAEDLSRSPLLSPGDYVRISVEDTGSGMSAEVRQRAFEPFFTTKGGGKGTGMGLAVAWGIVKKHGGQIEVNSTPGCGSSFHFYLPLAEAVAVADRPRAPGVMRASTGSMATSLVLLLEDELILQKSTQRLLELNGFAVVCASDGQEAINLYREHQDMISVALLDMVVPKISGPKVFEAIHAMSPALPILLTSGYVVEVAVEDLLEQGAAGFIAKPWNTADLLEGLRRALDPAGARPQP